MKIFLGSILLCALSGNAAWAQDAVEGKGGEARVRFFGQAAIAITLYKNQACVGGKGIQVSKTNLGALFGNSKSISLGMPETPNVTNLKSRDGILFAAFYREYAVRAGEPITIAAQYYETTGDSRMTLGNVVYTHPGISRGCKKIDGSFTPEAGKDYELTVDIGSPTCQFTLTQVDVKDAAVQLTPVALAESRKCAAGDVLPIALCKATLAECKEDVLEKFHETTPEGKPDKAAFAACTAEYKTCAAATK